MDNSIGLTTKYCTKKIDEVEKARSLFGLEQRKGSDRNGRKNQRFARRKQKDAKEVR